MRRTSRPRCLDPVDSSRPCGPALVQCFESVAFAAAGCSTFGSWQPCWEDMYQDQDTRSQQQHSERAIAYAGTANACAEKVTACAETATAILYCSCEGCHRYCCLNPAGGAQHWARAYAAAHSWWDARSGAYQGCCIRSMSTQGYQHEGGQVEVLPAEGTGNQQDGGSCQPPCPCQETWTWLAGQAKA